MHVVAAVFVVENLAISGHENGYGIGQEEHPGGHGARQAVGSGIAHARVLQVYRIHQMVKRYVGVATAETGKQRSEKAGKGDERVMAEGAEEQIEPDNIGFLFANRVEDAGQAGEVVKSPAAFYIETFEFGCGRGESVGEYGEANKRIALQFLRNMKAVFAESALTGRKSCNQTNFHSLSGLTSSQDLSKRVGPN
jgi:hypothetical protein